MTIEALEKSLQKPWHVSAESFRHKGKVIKHYRSFRTRKEAREFRSAILKRAKKEGIKWWHTWPMLRRKRPTIVYDMIVPRRW